MFTTNHSLVEKLNKVWQRIYSYIDTNKTIPTHIQTHTHINFPTKTQTLSLRIAFKKNQIQNYIGFLLI